MIAGQSFDSARFLRDYWQQQPLFLPAQARFDNPLSPEELAGLALEPGVEARLVREQDNDWRLEPGPLHERSFDGETPWTLLVQRVDHYVPAVTALRDWVSFLPRWRLDDIMVSYATDGGGVGPHYDNYDVFLVQGMGQRQWRLGQRCGPDTALRNNPDLRILEGFEDSAEYLLNPGDILYVPPGLAHWGTAVGNGMTYSIGFRAPRVSDMLSRRVDQLLPDLDEEQLYLDPRPLPVGRAGEITATSLDAARTQLRQILDATQDNGDWFGELVTEAPEAAPPSDDEPLPGRVRLQPDSRLAWQQLGDELRVYANGDTLHFSINPELLEILCSGRHTTVPANGPERQLLQSLWQTGCLLDD